jgi:hypothetical protein
MVVCGRPGGQYGKLNLHGGRRITTTTSNTQSDLLITTTSHDSFHFPQSKTTKPKSWNFKSRIIFSILDCAFYFAEQLN